MKDSKYIYQNELGKTCFSHHLTFGDLRNKYYVVKH